MWGSVPSVPCVIIIGFVIMFKLLVLWLGITFPLAALRSAPSPSLWVVIIPFGKFPLLSIVIALAKGSSPTKAISNTVVMVVTAFSSFSPGVSSLFSIVMNSSLFSSTIGTRFSSAPPTYSSLLARESSSPRSISSGSSIVMSFSTTLVTLARRVGAVADMVGVGGFFVLVWAGSPGVSD